MTFVTEQMCKDGRAKMALGVAYRIWFLRSIVLKGFKSLQWLLATPI